MDSKQLVTTIRTLIQAEMKKTLKPVLREVLKPLLQEMIQNKVNEILAEKYVQSLSMQQVISEQKPKSIPQAQAPKQSKIEELKKKYQIENSPLGSLLEGMEEHEVRAALSHQPGSPVGLENDDDEGVPLDMITGLMRR